MKKIVIMALVLIGSISYSAEAQQKREACKAPDGKVCKKVGKNGVACYKTPYAHNFKICKGAYGYYVCCEEPNATNSTFPPIAIAKHAPSQQEYDYSQTYAVQTESANDDYDNRMPQSQSYPRYSANTAVAYEGYYPKNRIKVCNNTDNVAEANRAAYAGCPTPAYDGPEKNKKRNVNLVSSSSPNGSGAFPVPPNSGTKQ